MLVKKFEAPTLEDALSRIKQELGPDALILSTEEKKNNWFGKSCVEVTAAYEKSEKPVVAKAPPRAEEGFDEREIMKVFPHRRSQIQQAAQLAVRSADTEKRRAAANRYDGAAGQETPPPRPPEVNTQVSRFETEFTGLGFSPEAAKELARRLAFDYAKKDLNDPKFLRKTQTKLIAGGISTLSSEAMQTKSQWVAIGLPGSGKTSCLVKVALHLRGLHRSVSLVSRDARKVSGRQELSHYARLIKVPFSADQNLPRVVARMMLVDSPSLSFHSEEEGVELERLCSGRSVVLVLDVCQRLPELLRTVEASRRYNPAAIAFTRIDLASAHGVVYDVLKAAKLPLFGFSLSRSFTTPFKFFEPTELAGFLLGQN